MTENKEWSGHGMEITQCITKTKTHELEKPPWNSIVGEVLGRGMVNSGRRCHGDKQDDTMGFVERQGRRNKMTKQFGCDGKAMEPNQRGDRL